MNEENEAAAGGARRARYSQCQAEYTWQGEVYYCADPRGRNHGTNHLDAWGLWSGSRKRREPPTQMSSNRNRRRGTRR